MRKPKDSTKGPRWVKVITRAGVTLWHRLDQKNRYDLSYDGQPPKGPGHLRSTVLDRFPKEEASA